MSRVGAKLTALTAAVAGICLAWPAPAQELWNGASLGMTPAEVRATFPKAAQGERTVNGEDVVLRVPDLRAGGYDATAFFDFANNGLRTVELRLSPGRAGARVDSGEIVAQLNAKYGPATDCEPGGDKCEWRSGATDITLIDAQRFGREGVEILYTPLVQTAGVASGEALAPVSLVRAFYGALTHGDGDRASRLVVPEKRGRAPFSAEALTNFYASLPGPIHLTAAYPISGRAVFVRYQFVASGGRFCDGDADVTTARVGDQLLIDSIRAYEGC